MDQPALAVLMVQVRPEGRVSVKLTPRAWPEPILLSGTSELMSSAAETGPTGLAAFSTLMSGQLTVTVAVAELFVLALAASLVAEAEAGIATVPTLAD